MGWVERPGSSACHLQAGAHSPGCRSELGTGAAACEKPSKSLCRRGEGRRARSQCPLPPQPSEAWALWRELTHTLIGTQPQSHVHYSHTHMHLLILVHIHIHTFRHMLVHTCTLTYSHVYTYVHKQMHTYLIHILTLTHAVTHTLTHTCSHTHTLTCSHTYTCLYTLIHTFTYLHI